jgi:hypothetical protein
LSSTSGCGNDAVNIAQCPPNVGGRTVNEPAKATNCIVHKIMRIHYRREQLLTKDNEKVRVLVKSKEKEIAVLNNEVQLT